MKKPEITWQSVSGAFLISALISMAYPYIVLKLGMGPNVSVLAAFLGAIFLFVTAVRTRGQNAVQNNIIQTAATSATSTAFMCVVAAAFGYLSMNETVGQEAHMKISPWQMFSWLSCSGTIGVLIAALFRRYFIEDPEMIFADGVAAAETINVLDSSNRQSSGKMKTLGLGALVGLIIAFLRDGLGKISILAIAMRFRIGIEWSVLSMGTGLLISLNVGLSMLLGTIVVGFFGPMVINHSGLEIIRTGIAPQYLNRINELIASAPLSDPTQIAFVKEHGGMAWNYLCGNHFPIAMLWFMWPATALMIFAALTAVILKWRSIVEMFRTLLANRETTNSRSEVSLTTITVLCTLLTIVLAYIQYNHFGMPYWQTILSVLFGLPLILVGVRVLGETNQGPVSLMANTVQAIFRMFSPHIGHNLVASGMAGDINSQGEGTMQVFKTGKLVGSTPRVLTWVQFLSIPIGAAAVAIMYPLLIHRYGLGGDGLAAPTGLKLANMAVLMSKGISGLPPEALQWTIMAAICGVILTLLKDVKKWKWLPSAAGFGFALILPGFLNIPIAIGSIAGSIWKKVSPITYERHCITLASGFIGGEALVAGLILPVLFYFGII